MKKSILALLLLFPILSWADCAVVEDGVFAPLNWTAPGFRQDGTPLALTEILGYKIYFTDTSDNTSCEVSINSAIAVSHLLPIRTNTSYTFAMTTLDIDGRESGLSPENTYPKIAPITDPNEPSNINFTIPAGYRAIVTIDPIR